MQTKLGLALIGENWSFIFVKLMALNGRQRLPFKSIHQQQQEQFQAHCDLAYSQFAAKCKKNNKFILISEMPWNLPISKADHVVHCSADESHSIWFVFVSLLFLGLFCTHWWTLWMSHLIQAWNFAFFARFFLKKSNERFVFVWDISIQIACAWQIQLSITPIQFCECKC